MPVDALSTSQGVLNNAYRKVSEITSAKVAEHYKNLKKRYQQLAFLIAIVLILEALLIFRPLQIGLRKTLNKVTETQKTLDYTAHYDGVTELLNLNGLIRHSGTLGEEEKEYNLLLIRIINMPPIISSIGTKFEAEFYKKFSSVLTKQLNANLLPARVSDTEFAILMNRVAEEDGIVELILKTLSRVIYINQIPINTEIHTTLANVPGNGICLEEALMNARIARQEYKDNSKGFVRYDESMTDAIAREKIIISEIREAVKKNEFVPHYQLKIDGETDEIVGMEALARWEHSVKGTMPPSKFIGLAEKTGLIVPITWNLLEKIKEDYISWIGKNLKPGRIAFNASADVLLDKEFLDVIDDILDDIETATGISENILEVEITENIALAEDDKKVKSVLKELTNRGVTIALDDFGTGYASLSTLSDLEYDVVKIDRSFVADIHKNDSNRLIVQSILSICQKMNKYSVAEGIETEAEAKVLYEMGCSAMQGYYYSKPKPASDLIMHLDQLESNVVRMHVKNE